jgi:DNA-directed RNA polymerase II subunit RPB2
MTNNFSWSLIDKMFKDNPYLLVEHHLNSYNNFYENGIYKIFKDNNPLRFIERNEEKDNEILSEIKIYMGGENGDEVFFGKPVMYDNNSGTKFMYPNDARLKNLNYSMTIHYNVVCKYIYFDRNENKKIEIEKKIEKIYLGKFPIMLHSNKCILKDLPRDVRYNMGECLNDLGGYFIINGKEKTIVCQEKFSNNILYIRKHIKSKKCPSYEDDECLIETNEPYICSAEIRSVSEDPSKPTRYTSVRIVTPSSVYSNRQIVVDIPNVRKPVPLFILMRALGVVSDKSIIECCLLDLDKNENMIDLFIPSIHDANRIFNQEVAIKYISYFTKRKTTTGTMEILMNYLLPHIGELNFLDKAYFIGFMVFKLLRVYTNKEQETDRDNFKYKRVDLSGDLIYELFREYYLIQKRNIERIIDEEFYFHKIKYQENNITLLIEDNYQNIFKERVIEDGFKKAYKGNWGATTNTKRLGVVQDLNRLSWNSFISHLRKINLDIPDTAKLVPPRLLNSSQWGIIDPVDTPDGGNIGTHKHLSIGAIITTGYSSFFLIKWLRNKFKIKVIQECSNQILSIYTKLFINGIWIGIIEQPVDFVEKLKKYKHNGIIPIYTSITFNIESNIIYIYTDSGRLMRPLYYIDKKLGYLAYKNKSIQKILFEDEKYSWSQLLTGFLPKKDENFSIKKNEIYDIERLYGFNENVDEKNSLENYKGVIEYLDTMEEEDTLIAMKYEDLKNNSFYTHLEIEPSLILGVMGNQIPFPECNQLPRDLFSCGQSKQAVSVYNTNYTLRMDKMGVILNYGEIPIIKSRYLKYFNNEETPYGVNTIVAIMSYTGYNVEDAILINKGSVDRGLFRTTYYTTYQSYEESSKVSGENVNSFFSDVMSKNVKNIKKGYDYSFLDEYGLIKENTPVDDKTVLIGKLVSSSYNNDTFSDDSTFPKKGQLGVIDKSFVTEGEEGFRIAKIRVAEQRIPAIGDKMGSRIGQKGTIGLIIPEENMPYTSDGVRPDLIINPHALPSRMTIGQLIECLFGKVCTMYGSFGDCTAFGYNGPNMKTYGEMLNEVGFHSSGNQLLYDGMTGEQLESDIFIGPTYYMRLKHMVKDKINYRAKGPKTLLTRQSVHGRANDGGLRIGEMERDGIIAHGMSYFLNESFLKRGDEYYMAVCNKTGSIAIYNETLNLFLSPFIDGPIQFSKGVNNVECVNSISRFGRSFSIVRIPYSLKLLIQELQVLNIQMRIITDANIDNLLSMNYSDNINKLLHNDKSIDEIVPLYKKMMLDKLRKNNLSSKQININNYNKPNKQKDILPEINIDYNKEDDLTENKYNDDMEINWDNNNIKVFNDRKTSFATDLPPYPDVSSPYAPVSPPYAPVSPYSPVSPPYSPVLPQYAPVSPPYAPVSPPYSPVSQPYAPVSQPYAPVSQPYAPVPPQYAPVSPPYSPVSQPYAPVTVLEPYVDLNKSNIDKELENEEEKNDISENILNKKNKEIKNKYDKLSEREKILISDLLKKDDEEKKTILTDIEKEEETEKENEIKKIIKI